MGSAIGLFLQPRCLGTPGEGGPPVKAFPGEGSALPLSSTPGLALFLVLFLTKDTPASSCDRKLGFLTNFIILFERERGIFSLLVHSPALGQAKARSPIMVSIWDAGIAGRSLTHYTMAPASSFKKH